MWTVYALLLEPGIFASMEAEELAISYLVEA